VPQRPEDLVQHGCVNYRQISRGRLHRWKFQRDGEEFEIAVTGRVIANDAPTLMRCAVEGLGLVSHIESVVRPWIARGEVRTVLDEYSVVTPGYFLCFPARAQVLPKLRAFIECLQEPSRRPSDVVAKPTSQQRKQRWKWDMSSNRPLRMP
jgi:DNA-binding transcriptional LysR family regulator